MPARAAESLLDGAAIARLEVEEQNFVRSDAGATDDLELQKKILGRMVLTELVYWMLPQVPAGV
jgi:hypothetical protein